EPFPKIFLTRRVINDGSEYLGPFTSVSKVRELMNFIRQTIQLRNCSLNLTQKNIEKGKFKVCLEYHLGNCKGPCESLQSPDDYAEGLAQVKNLLRGNLSSVLIHFKKEMKNYAEQMQFEKAELVKKKIEFLTNYQAKSVIVSSRLIDVDVFSIVEEGDIAYINYLMVNNGTIVQTHTNKVETHLDESSEEILIFSIDHIRSLFKSNAREIIVPFPVEYPDKSLLFTIPKAGDKKKLLELSEKNVNYFIEEVKKKQRLKIETKKSDKIQLLEELQKDLQLPSLPDHIECFDNSNFQGSYPVSAMVCFKNGEPSKKDYRHFNVKTVEGINDFATMKEAVLRRYKRLSEENQPFPQLVIIDGGKGQLNAALEAIKDLHIEGRSTLVGLAKNEEEIFFAGDKESLKLPYNSNSLKLIRRIRDEVHRFGITFHRKKRAKGTFKNELEEIKGIGKPTAELLLQTFKSVNTIKNKTIEDLAEIIGKAKARLVFEHFHQT
ncbi:MAG: excinuclease ABC subunit UvrC, partial [Bacteroidetes bacterium]|nr:excinuclease ABC subunit UvrC [Bacteroidota bacterium]